ncbi:hypothetical protein HYH03_001352 [Edaphochlamys debaryana]|uniref:Cytochrome b5 heme-binding domain-containing protein n=1 Tax=Edaphochlamys debaryana TaxID=47281 RepID=A0A835YMU9_9CHLO|nr:hypothetical protein HYH03_001352 [Edaphochlamys debaryana]|eukprot:KAG2500584.1 hypothetical protein HYH03_001352 [Edaphochlamys debaryana]
MVRFFTPEELLAFDGSDADKPVYIAVKGVIYDVSQSREFYGKGGPYEAFAGRECSRALAIMKVDAAECNDNLADCTEKQLKTLEDWCNKFNSKYPIVGQVQKQLCCTRRPLGACTSVTALDDVVEVPPVESLLRTTFFTPSLLAGMALVVLLTALGAYVLWWDLQHREPGAAAEDHTEL